MNENWQGLYEGYAPESAKQALLSEQRKWIALKESACQYFVEELHKTDCISGMTERLIDDLKEYLGFEFE